MMREPNLKYGAASASHTVWVAPRTSPGGQVTPNLGLGRAKPPARPFCQRPSRTSVAEAVPNSGPRRCAARWVAPNLLWSHANADAVPGLDHRAAEDAQDLRRIAADARPRPCRLRGRAVSRRLRH